MPEAPTQPPAATNGKPAPLPARGVRVVAVSAGEVVIDAGQMDGISEKDWLVVSRVMSTSDALPGFVDRRRMAVVRVASLQPTFALCKVPRGARIEVGDVIERASGGEDTLIYPRHQSRMFELAMNLRPFLKVGGPLGGGFLIDGDATYHGNGYFVGARLLTLGLGWSKEADAVSTAAFLEAGYDAQPVAVGIGFGAGHASGEATPSGVVPVVSQNVRVGAQDGLNLRIINVLYYGEVEGVDAGFRHGATTLKLRVPIMDSTDIVAEGGGGALGYGYGALGVHTWLKGLGDPGSVGFSIAGTYAALDGRAAITDSTFSRSVLLSGPSVSVGFDYRWGL